jgi:hypothetical protein
VQCFTSGETYGASGESGTCAAVSGSRIGSGFIGNKVNACGNQVIESNTTIEAACDFLGAQLQSIKDMGVANYLAQQVKE